MDETDRTDDPTTRKSPAPGADSSKPASARPGPALLRIVLAVLFVSIATVLVVEGILIKQVGLGQSLVGRVTGVMRGSDHSVLSFDYVTMDGRDFANQCRVPTEFVDTLVPGQVVEVYHRIGLSGIYACAREGLDGLHAEGSKSMYWGLLFGVLGLAMILWLLADLWRYTRVLEARRLQPEPNQE